MRDKATRLTPLCFSCPNASKSAKSGMLKTISKFDLRSRYKYEEKWTWLHIMHIMTAVEYQMTRLVEKKHWYHFHFWYFTLAKVIVKNAQTVPPKTIGPGAGYETITLSNIKKSTFNFARRYIYLISRGQVEDFWFFENCKTIYTVERKISFFLILKF